MQARASTKRHGRVQHVGQHSYQTHSSDSGIYQVDSGPKLYETARKIAEMGLEAFIRTNPPPPPFKRPDQ